jgi:hypothetical protein
VTGQSCPNWGMGPCGFNGGPCARGCVHVPALTVAPARPVERPACAGCGQPLLLIREGRTTYERCRLEAS